MYKSWDERTLVGKVIKSVWINPHKTEFTLRCEDGDHSFEAYGDCCSSSWIEHITGVTSLTGAKVVSINDVDIETIEEHPEHECLQIYSTQIVFESPHEPIEIEYRNSSNGYYGGSLVSIDTTLENMKPLTEDF